MRHSFKSRDEVCHLWAHQTQESAYCGNVYFNGNTIYSYGSHFPMGKVLDTPNGEWLYVLNSDTYSATTAKHISEVRHSIPGHRSTFSSKGCVAPCFKDGKLYRYKDAVSVVADYINNMVSLMNRQKRARTVSYHSCMVDTCKSIAKWIELWQLNEGKRWYDSTYSKKYHIIVIDDIMSKDVKDYDEAAKMFHCEKSEVDQMQICYRLLKEHGLLSLTAFSSRTEAYNVLDEVIAEFFGDETAEVIKARSEKIAKSDRLRAMRIAKSRINEDKGNLNGWRNHKYYTWYPSHYWSSAYGWHTALRMDKNNENIETSQGITIKPEEGKRLWLIIKAFEAGKPFKREIALDMNGSKWLFNRYENHTLFAGCHAIPFTECKRIAKIKGWV